MDIWGQIADGASWALLVAGALFCMAGGVGILRFPDVYTRSHAAGVIDTAGAILILAGLMIQAGLTLITVKLIIILFFLLFTGPVATHALVKAALSGGQMPLTGPRGKGE
ncbi:MAG: monovalent cation/H(+) antiporter subunit G [Bauldia litoralis]